MLNGLLTDFPFETGEGETKETCLACSVAVAAMMTTVLRGALPVAVPIFLINATEPRSGKTYLVHLITVLATGHIPPSTAGASEDRHKLAAICTATSEMLRSPSAEDLIRQCLIEATGPALDRALFSAAPASDERPAGLLFGIAPTPVPAGDIIDALVALASAVAPVAGNGQLAIVAAPTQAVAINLRLTRPPPYVVLASMTLTPGEGPPSIDANTDAVVHEETGPAVNIGGGVTAHPLRSFFQSDTVGLRLRWPISWALRDARAIAWMEV
jgi:hypothetical protein